LSVLAGGLLIGTQLHTVRYDDGVPFLVGGTLLFAVGAVLMKLVLRSVSVALVMTMKMTLGSALLLGYVGLTGRLGMAWHLSTSQWAFALVTGLILLAFTLSEIQGLRHASATGVMAVSAGAPIVTVLLTVAGGRTLVDPRQLLGLGMVLGAVLTVYAIGRRDEGRRAVLGSAAGE
jgi:drug/metabolite transporter (DMT)-like permease